MKYIIATILSVAVLFLFAVFAALVGWRHGGGYLVQAALWFVIAVLWGAVVKNWNTIVARLRRGEPPNVGMPIFDENVRFTVLAGLIIIIGAGLFFAMKSNRPPVGITAAELIQRYNDKYKYDGDVIMQDSAGVAIVIPKENIPAALARGGTFVTRGNPDQVKLYQYLMNHPELRIYNSRGDKWVGDDD